MNRWTLPAKYVTLLCSACLVAALFAAANRTADYSDTELGYEYDSAIACDTAATLLETMYAGSNASDAAHAAYFSSAVETLEASVHAICGETVMVRLNWTYPEKYHWSDER